MAEAPVEASPSVPTQAEIRSQQLTRMEEGRRGMIELQNKGINLAQLGKKQPSEVIKEINGKVSDKWHDDEPTQRYIAGAIDLHSELQMEILQLKLVKIKNGEPIDDDAIAAEAEKNVLENRIKDATPTEIAVDDSAPTAEEIVAKEQDLEEEREAQEKADAEATEKKRIVDATTAWVNSQSPEKAREVLEAIVTQIQEGVVINRIEGANEERRSAETREQADTADKKIEYVHKVLAVTQKEIETQRKKLKKLQTDSSAPVEDRLLAYDIDLAQTKASLSEADTNVLLKRLKMEAARTPEDSTIAQRDLNAATAKQNSLTERIEMLETERANIGTAEQQDVNYVAGVVIDIMKNVPLAENQIAEQVQATIIADPFAFLQKQIDNPEVGLTTLLAKSGISEKNQQKLLEIASAESAMKTVKNKEVQDKVLGGGKLSILAILLLIYTSYGANKKAKGGGM